MSKVGKQIFDELMMDLAKELSKSSPNRSTKTACVITKNNAVITSGFNTFPDHVLETEERHEAPARYQWIEHAERNAIYNAAKRGYSLEGSTAYVPWFPCMECARALAQSGIKMLVAYRPDVSNPRWNFGDAIQLLKETNVTVRYLEQ